MVHTQLLRGAIYPREGTPCETHSGQLRHRDVIIALGGGAEKRGREANTGVEFVNQGGNLR